MPLTIALTVGTMLIAWGVTVRIRRPESGRARVTEPTGDPAVDMTLQAAIPLGSGVGQVLVGMVIVVTALATLVVS